jgi:hypothetical protein
MSINPGGRNGERVKLPGSQASKSSGVSSQAAGSPKAWGFKGDFRRWEDLLRVGE